MKRILLLLGIVLAILVTISLTFLSGSQLSRVVNLALPQGWTVVIPKGTELDWQGVSLPHLTLRNQGCSILQLDETRLQWQDSLQLSTKNLALDYQCLQQLPKSESDSNSRFSLNYWLAMIPQGKISVEKLQFNSLPADFPERLQPLLNQPTKIDFAFSPQKTTAYLHNPQAEMWAELDNLVVSGQIHYQPSKKERHSLTFQTELNGEDLLTLPQNSRLDYRWQLPPDIVASKEWQKGTAEMQWKNNKGELAGQLALRFPNQPKNKLDFPFKFDFSTLSIEQGEFHWEMLPTFPLKGFVTARLTPKNFKQGKMLPLASYLRFSLLSQNEFGKGNIVIENKDGEWQADKLKLPLRLTGNIKHGNFVLYSSVPLDLSGTYNDLTLKFLQSSLIRVTGSERFLTIKDLRFPLAGISVNQKGIRGRLQAIFKGESPDFKNIELHWDGFAQNFKAGLLDFFKTDTTIPKKQRDQWQWRFWGDTYSTGAASKLTINGRGNWHKRLITLSEFNGKLGKIKQYALTIPSIEMQLHKPIQYAYTQDKLSGGLKMSTKQITFDYGGELPKVVAQLDFQGKLDNLNFNGEIKADKIGPLKFFARRRLQAKADSSELIGRLYWKEQPANVFQTLFPFRQNRLITGGTIRGETAFNFSAAKGITAGGHFAIRNGSLSMPSGDAQGITFSLPYRLNDGQLDFGVKQPLSVQIERINFGTLPLDNVQLKVDGHYPYSKRKPLNLSQLSFNLLGGKLSIERFALPQRNIAYLKLTGIDFEKILEFVQYQQLDLKGKADATLPFWLEGKPCYVCDGLFTQNGESRLKFTPELLEAMKKGGYTEQILMYLVNDSRITDLRGMINLGSKGDMVLDTKIRMELVEHQNAKINLNYNHKENLFDLWKLINYGSEFEQNIENNLYKKLDKKK